MNITFYSNVTTKEKALRYIPQLADNNNIRFIKLEDREELLTAAKDTEVLVIDAMGTADANIIISLPKLKLIQSEGVGYQGIDVDFASEMNIPVCNNSRVNDTAVAECALLLILSCLKNIIICHQSVYDGRQIEMKKQYFGTVRELGQCTVGLIGFGNTAKKTAMLCNAFGAKVVYYNRTRYAQLEREYNVEYKELDELLAVSDFVSLHIASDSQTRNFVDKAFLSKMKNDAFLINTARGDLVDNEALLNALLNNEIGGAGLDVISPEPVTQDNILLDERIKDKLILTPHIAGITNLTIQKIYKNIHTNITRLINNDELINRLN